MKAKVKATGKIVDGIPIYYGSEGKGYLHVPVDHDIFDRYDIEEVEFLEQPAWKPSEEQKKNESEFTEKELDKILDNEDFFYDLYNSVRNNKAFTYDDFSAAINKHLIELKNEEVELLEQPSLPEGLEEAAIDFADNARKELFAKDYAISSIADYDHGCIDGFIAGAEWMKAKMLEKAVEFECIGKKVKMTIQELINYYIDQECCDVADECGF